MASILYVIDAMPFGGGPFVCYTLAKSIADTALRPCVVTLFAQGALGERLEHEGVPQLCLNLQHPFRLIRLAKAVRAVVSFARHHDVCLVHAHLLAAGLYGGLAARIMKVPAVYTAHGVLAVNAPLRFAEIAIRHLFRAIVGVSRHGEIELRRYILGKKRQKVRCIYNGIDTDYWVMTPGREQLFPRDGRSIKLTMVANFFKEKDHWTALEAFLLFRGKYPNSCLTLAGDGEQRDQVESWVRQIQISNVLLTGAVEDIRSLLMRTDIFVLASFTEGISIAVLEAMAMGLPVVASDVGGMREIITHGVDGFLVPPRDPQAFFQAVDTLIAQPLLRVSLGQKARERVISAFSVTAMTSAYQSLYHELLGTAR